MLNSNHCGSVKGHKANIKTLEVLDFNPKKVYYPLINNFGIPLTAKVKKGQNVKKGDLIGICSKFGVPIFSSINGKVGAEKEVEIFTGQMTNAIVIEATKDQEPFTKFKPMDWEKEKQSKILDRIHDAGIVGLGGAGFPTHIKYTAACMTTLIVNAVECEPYLVSDYMVIKKDLKDLMTGISIAKKATNVEKIVIAIKSINKLVIKALKEEISERGLGNIVKIKKVANKYPMGWERNLVRKIMKKEYTHLPSEVGCVVSNSTTIVHLKKAVVDGTPITERIITVAGDALEEPKVLKVPTGTLIADVLKQVNIKAENYTVKVGGPLMGKSIKTANCALTSITNGLVINEVKPSKEMACAKCGKCTVQCPADLQPIAIYNAFKRHEFDSLVDLHADKCTECALCSSNCPSHIGLLTTIISAKKIAKSKIIAASAKQDAGKAGK